MKVIKWIGHPIVFIIVYLLFITEGENFGGFYMLYIMLALPHGGLYAILALFGIGAIVIGFNLQIDKYFFLQRWIYLIGFCFLTVSLINFFNTGDQTATFKSGVPIASFILLCVCSISFLIYALCCSNKR